MWPGISRAAIRIVTFTVLCSVTTIAWRRKVVKPGGANRQENILYVRK